MNDIPGRVLILLLLLRGEKLVRGTQLDLHGDFDTQVRHLISHEMLAPEEVRLITTSFNQTQEILRNRWKDADLLVYGSLATGLATKTSDVDVYLRIPNIDNNTEAYFANETANILHKYPEKYIDIELSLDQKPMTMYYDVSLQRHIDLWFRSIDGVEKNKLITYYLNLDERFLPLAAVIKLWCKYNDLVIKGGLKNYTVYLMVIFYLQQKNMIPAGHVVQTQAPPVFVTGWNMNFKEIPHSIDNNENLYELLGGFFKFYSDFNFTEYCVSVFVGRPIPKKDLADVDKIPQELSLYKNKLKAGECKPLLLQTTICVQDMYELNINVGRQLNDVNYKRFTKYLRYAAKVYDQFDSTEFLSEILSKNKHEMLSAGTEHTEL